MRNKTLDQIVDDIRLEAGRSSKANLGLSERPAIVKLANRVYEKLYLDHNWPHLEIERYISGQAGQRYYDMPEDMDFERILKTEVKYGGTWQPIYRGITRDHIDVVDSESDQRQDPLRRWDIKYTGTAEQVELWPIPAANYTNNIYIKGILKFQPMVEGSDRCLLDNNLIALYAAGELLAKGSKQDAAIKLKEGKDLYDTLKKRSDNKFPNRVNRNGHDPYGGGFNKGSIQNIHVAHVVDSSSE